jgi:cytochrome c biogenesis protein CcmG/thiol:disulfide interchange protein DsbE
VNRRLFFLAAAGAAVRAQPSRLTPVDETGYRSLLASLKGQVALVDFWATWCAPCRAEMPALVALGGKYGARGFRLVTISCDEPEQEAGALSLLKQRGAPSPAYIKRPKDDDAFINSVDPKWSGQLPALFLFDRQGRKVRAFYGESSTAEIDAALRRLL